MRLTGNISDLWGGRISESQQPPREPRYLFTYEVSMAARPAEAGARAACCGGCAASKDAKGRDPAGAHNTRPSRKSHRPVFLESFSNVQRPEELGWEHRENS